MFYITARSLCEIADKGTFANTSVVFYSLFWHFCPKPGLISDPGHKQWKNKDKPVLNIKIYKWVLVWMKTLTHHKPQHWRLDNWLFTLMWSPYCVLTSNVSLKQEILTLNQSLRSHARNHAGTTQCTVMGEGHNRAVGQAMLGAIQIRTAIWDQNDDNICWFCGMSANPSVYLNQLNYACTLNTLCMQSYTKRNFLKPPYILKCTREITNQAMISKVTAFAITTSTTEIVQTLQTLTFILTCHNLQV